jgi:hypothetical protein
MDYALIAFAAAYSATGDPKYLDGLDSGIAWLAARQEMSDPDWKGSWFYAYSSTPPYDPIPTSPGPGVRDVRGVDATCSLFSYLVYLRDRITNTTAASATYADNVKAALNFVLTKDRRADGFFASSWQKRSGVWKLWKFAYSADQGDVYLGLRAGQLLYADATFGAAADFLEAEVPAAFSTSKRFALGMDVSGHLDTSMGGFNAIWPQGYLPWIFGDNEWTRRAGRWLDTRVRSDGSVSVRPRARTYSLSAAILAMSRAALSKPKPGSTVRWIKRVAFDRPTGGVRDTGSSGPLYDNVAGFTAVALLRFPVFGP